MSEWRTVDDLLRDLTLWERFRVWLAGFKVRRMLREKRYTIATLCWQCLRPIIESDDDACVCIQCGGRNRRASDRVSGEHHG